MKKKSINKPGTSGKGATAVSSKESHQNSQENWRVNSILEPLC